MLPRSLNNHAPDILPAVVDNQTSSVVATGHRSCIYTIGPPSESLGYTTVQPRSSDCATRNDTVLVKPAQIPEYR